MIDEKTVIHIANLSKLKLDDQEVKLYANQLSEVVKHFETLSRIDTDEVEEMQSPSPIERTEREDIRNSESGSETSLENAPDSSGNLFKVPPVV